MQTIEGKTYEYFTVGGYFANGRPLDGGECATFAEAQDACAYFEGDKAYPVIYGWNGDEATNVGGCSS